MKDFYEFLNGHNGGNFVGFLFFCGIIGGTLVEIAKALRKPRK